MQNDHYKYLDVDVLYLQRIGLPNGVTVSLTLADISRQDVAAAPLASQTLRSNSNVPFNFQLRYDSRVVDDTMTYALQARIEHEGRLLFTNTQHCLVALDGSEAKVSMILQGSPFGISASD